MPRKTKAQKLVDRVNPGLHDKKKSTIIDLTETERALVLKLRTLAKDPAFAFLGEAYCECLDVLLDRNQRYNTEVGVYDNTFEDGDAEMWSSLKQPVKRLRNAVGDGNGSLRKDVPAEEMGDLLHDTANWSMIWLINRKLRSRRE